jgi:hypothetical protein
MTCGVLNTCQYKLNNSCLVFAWRHGHVIFKLEQEGLKTSSMLDSITMLQGKYVLVLNDHNFEIIFSLVLKFTCSYGGNSRFSLILNFLSSFTIFGKEKLEDGSSIMIDAKETKIER